jgi:hypothetical protein
MLIRLRFSETDIPEQTVQLHGELPKAGAVIEFEGGTFTVSALPTTWHFHAGELIPVLHVLPKSEYVPA